MSDVFTDALNAPAGRLVEVLLKKLPEGTAGKKLSTEFRQRLDRVVDAPGRSGKLARVRLAPEIPLLFDRAPDWTKRKILPLFEWSSADASDVEAPDPDADADAFPELDDDELPHAASATATSAAINASSATWLLPARASRPDLDPRNRFTS